MFKKYLFLIIAFVFLIPITSCENETQPEAKTPQAVVEAYLQASSEGDVDACLRLIADEIVFRQDPPGTLIEKKADFEAFLKQSASWGHTTLLTGPLSVNGERVTCTIKENGDELKTIGMDSMGADVEFLVKNGKIASISGKPLKEDWDKYLENTSGGIGIEYKVIKQGIQVEGIAPYSLATQAGLQVGDIITAVNGINCLQMKEGEFQLRCKGTIGSIVRLTVARKSASEPIDLEITRVQLNNEGPQNMQQLQADAFSTHFASGYSVQLCVSDSNQTIRSVNVTGPGINGTLSLVFLSEQKQWWSQPNVDLGISLPNTPLVYTFTVTDNSGKTYSLRDQILNCVVEFATDLSPHGSITTKDNLVFSWTGINLPEVKYMVQLSSKHGDQIDRIWNSFVTNKTSIVYDGPTPNSGFYEYCVCAISKEGDQSLVYSNFELLP